MSHLMTKPTKWHVRPAKTQINLGIRPVWSESPLSAWRKIGPLTTYWAHSEDSDQTGRMPRQIWVIAGRTCHLVGFVIWIVKLPPTTWHKWRTIVVKPSTKLLKHQMCMCGRKKVASLYTICQEPSSNEDDIIFNHFLTFKQRRWHNI